MIEVQLTLHFLLLNATNYIWTLVCKSFHLMEWVRGLWHSLEPSQLDDAPHQYITGM